MVSNPNYKVSVPSSLRNVAIGPGWENKKGERHWLAEFSKEIEKVEIEKIKEEIEEVEFKVTYQGKFKDCETVSEIYKLNTKGLEITDEINKNKILVQIPLLETDGLNKSEIEIGKKGFKVKYMGHTYEIICIEPEETNIFLESFSAPNRNGIYKIGCFGSRGNRIKYRISFR